MHCTRRSQLRTWSFRFKVNFGFLGCFKAANPIIAARRWTIIKVYQAEIRPFAKNIVRGSASDFKNNNLKSQLFHDCSASENSV